MEHEGRRLWIVGLAVVALACGIYANSVGNGFAFDDLPLIPHNPLVSNLENLPRLFTSDFWEPHGKAGLYRPLVTTSYALERATFGDDPMGYHLSNVALHAAVSFLVLLLVWQLTRDMLVAGGSAMLFAAHAIHSEVVASVSTGRPELMAALFGLLCLVLHLRASAPDTRRPMALRGASLLCFTLALLSKESAITILALIALVDLFTANGSRSEGESPFTWSRMTATLASRWRVYAAFGTLTLCYLAVRVAVVGAIGSLRTPGFIDNPLAHIEPLWRVVNATAIAFRYLGLFLFPVRLSHDYSYDQVPVMLSWAEPALLGVAALLAATVALVAWSWRREPGIVLALGLFLASFSVGSNWLIPITAIMAERLLYLPSLGLCLLLVLGLHALMKRLFPSVPRQRLALAAALAVLVLGNGLRTVARNPDWRSNFTIRVHDVALHPRNAKLQTNTGFSYLEHGQGEEALAHFEAAIEIVEVPERFAEPFRGKVWSLLLLERRDEAKTLYEQVRVHVHDPYLEPALAGRAQLPFGRSPATPR